MAAPLKTPAQSVAISSRSTRAAPAFEKLHLALVPFGGGPRGKCAEITSLTRLGILVQRVESVLAGRQSADHENESLVACR